MKAYVIVFEYDSHEAVFFAANEEEAERVRASFHAKKGYGDFLTTQAIPVPVLPEGFPLLYGSVLAPILHDNNPNLSPVEWEDLPEDERYLFLQRADIMIRDEPERALGILLGEVEKP